MDAADRIIKNISEYGMLLLNENKYYPSVMSVGGDWDSTISLIEQREIFLSKAFMSRTTYLSTALYLCLKHFRQSGIVNENEKKVYNFLAESGGCDTEALKDALPLGKKELSAAMDALLADLHITVLKRGKTLNDNWSSYIWGTSRQWEQTAGLAETVPDREVCSRKIFEILGNNLTEKQILKLLKR